MDYRGTTKKSILSCVINGDETADNANGSREDICNLSTCEKDRLVLC